jgi:hypothetical protein
MGLPDVASDRNDCLSNHQIWSEWPEAPQLSGRQRGRPLRSAVKPATSAELAKMLKDYQTATEQHAIIVRYLTPAIEVLPKPECELLLEFAQNAKNHCERLHRMIKRYWQTSLERPERGRSGRTHD